MNDLIMDSGNLMEIGGPDIPEDGEDLADMTATKSEDPTTMDFHIQMRGYTMRDFETMVIAAAAQQLIGGRTFKKEIEAAVMAQADKRLNNQVGKAMSDVMGMAVTTRGKEVLTLGQMIGMEAKDYLTQPVNAKGEIETGAWGRDLTPRAAWLVQQYVRQHFAKEIKAALDGMVTELRAQIKSQLDAAIAAERARVLDALAIEAKRVR